MSEPDTPESGNPASPDGKRADSYWARLHAVLTPGSSLRSRAINAAALLLVREGYTNLTRLIANLIMGAMDYCNQPDSEYLYFADRPLFGVTLENGARREVVSVDRLYAGATYDANLKAELAYCDCEVLVDRTYHLPLGDRSWPDDTLVVFEYMDEGDGRKPAQAAVSG